MAEYLIQDTTLDAIADAINAKTGGSSAMTPAEMATAIAAIPSGASYDGLEIVEIVSGKITKAKWHGATIPYGSLYHWHYSLTPVVELDLSEVEHVEENGLANSTVIPINANKIKTIGTYGFTPRTSIRWHDYTQETLYLPEYTGETSTGRNGNSQFRFNENNNIWGTIIFPKCQYLSQYMFYSAAVSGINWQFGSIGYPVTGCGYRPFAPNQALSGIITIYTTGELLDTIKTEAQNQASSSVQFIYKAAEATEYGGVSYAAGDTILTNTP